LFEIFLGVYAELAKIQNFPYQALLKYKNVPFCGGSIISEQHILTGAHCVAGKSKNFPDMRIHLGTTYSNYESDAYHIYRVDIHPKYTGKLIKLYVFLNDIAIITVCYTFLFNN
jgi:secreted trypsin-like serine protease